MDSGSVRLDDLATDYFAGSFDFLSDEDEVIEGEFNPEPCPAIQNLYDPGVNCE